MQFDLLIENARIVDGTGAPWFRGAVGVSGGSIGRVIRGEDVDATAAERVDADGSVVCPGFIDTHSHSDLILFEQPTLDPKTRQGITTEILGQDGFSMAPMYREGGAQEWEDHLAGLDGRTDREWTWGSTAEYLDAIESDGVAANVAMLVGHGTARYNVLGMDDSAPTDAELDEMGDLVTESLEEGAIGFSTGLVYSPHVNASTGEVRELAARLAPYGRPFVAHIRSEGRWIWEAMDEYVDIGAELEIPLHYSHYKVAGTMQHGKADRANHVMEAARERGVDITFDQYPYTAGNTMLSAVLPPWVHVEGPERAMEHLDDPEARERMRKDIEEWRIEGWENPSQRSGWESVVVTSIDSEANRKYEGRDVAEIARTEGREPIDVVCDLLYEEDLEVSMIVHLLTEEDVRTIMQNERVGVATDGLFGGKPHPRTYATYPRVLSTYVREENLLTLEEAVRKMTSLPARAMGLQSKGLVRPGMDADLVVFDPALVDTRATFDDPRQFPRGMPHVIVDGEFVVRDGETTGATPGDAIRK